MLKRLTICLFLMLFLIVAAIWFDTAIAEEPPKEITVHSYTRRFTLALEAGINMISMPLEVKKIADQAIDGNLRASDLATAGSKLIAVQRNPSNQEWDAHASGVEFPVTSFDPSPTALTGTYTPAGGDDLDVYALMSGVNADIYGTHEQIPAGNYAFFDPTTISWVIRFDQSDGRFKAYIPGTSTEAMNFALESGKGYLVNVMKTTTIDLEGMPWGTPIFGQSPAAPAVKSARPWAFVVSGQLTVSIPLTEQSKVVVTNLRMGASILATTTISQNGQPYYSAVFVDPDRKPLVDSGDNYRVTLIDPRTDPIHLQFQVESADLSTAHLKADTQFSVLVPQTTSLGQNYPNPFNPETWIPFQLHQPTTVSVLVYNAAGKKVRQMDIGFRPAGSYHSMGRAVYWNGQTDLGEIVSSGVYFYTLQAGAFTSTRRLVILK
ncbi:MAG: T9SS type A sorting domain-containing protein [Candidatus Poribacteria bacterium]|jgi:hypothetical protein|nr:T9SS type A sorting domain-containing protein [Candidatus Poribacteria bacterium]MDP6747015.1 T9SS type A sorting domain-containing protein [Candidatus Poribacteria bacterium]MDP6997156.1 T9SS type A sorting domain-containing protein [Candidatus Poribacteria bacterium]